MAPLFQERAAAISDAMGAPVEVIEVENDFYGSIVTTAGLLAGEDIENALRADLRPEDVCLIPAEALNAESDGPPRSSPRNVAAFRGEVHAIVRVNARARVTSRLPPSLLEIARRTKVRDLRRFLAAPLGFTISRN